MDIALVMPILKNVQCFRKFHRRKREKFGFNFGNFDYEERNPRK